MPFDFLSNKYKPKPGDLELLNINRNTGKIMFKLAAFRFRDKDTRQMVVYIPSLDISGYGATEKKAEEMINFSLENFLTYLMELPSKKMNAELENFGWKHSTLKNKEFSKAYVDGNGELKNFNAVADTVEKLTLVASE
jgi:hypothetical protein